MSKALLCLGLLLLATGFLMQYSCLHNVDLSWNAKQIEQLNDYNGIITQDVTDMYQRSIMMLWATPLLFVFASMSLIGGIKHEISKGIL